MSERIKVNFFRIKLDFTGNKVIMFRDHPYLLGRLG